ncbi:hypothetical protein [Candidatus Pristimantibacillus sp. PTI5]|uniref:hypothetical protein n=1 Tax=Candidatus Pristimantibacillus sp. PTI5 TaxID=3400422 RepID=UPI003B025747
MGFLKGTGKFLGETAGLLLSSPFQIVGKAAGNKYLQQIGEGIHSVTANTGATLGQVAEGTYNTAKGIVTEDKNLRDAGLADVGTAVADTAKGVVSGVKSTYIHGKDVVEGIKTEDSSRIKKGAKALVATAVVSIVGVGIIEGLDIAEGAEGDVADSTIDTESTAADAEHHVNSHYVEGYTRADGTEVEGYWRDGDGDTSINNNDGYYQDNPTKKV